MNPRLRRLFLPLLLVSGALLYPIMPLLAHHTSNPTVLQTGDYVLAAVTKEISLPPNYRPSDLVTLTAVGEPNETAREIIVADTADLLAAARQAGVPLDIIGSFRSFKEQQATYAYWQARLASPDRFSARAGHSQHQLGTALGFGTGNPAVNFSQAFGATPQGKWLEANAWQYGFALSYPRDGEAITGYAWEPWHYRYIGKEAARNWHTSGLILQQFLLNQPQPRASLSATNNLITTANSPKVFHIASNGTKRWLPSLATFSSYGFDWNAIRKVTPEALAQIPNTHVISAAGEPGIYRLGKDHTKQGFLSLEALHAHGFTLADVVTVNQTELTSYPTTGYIE